MILDTLNKYIYESNHYDKIHAKNLSKIEILNLIDDMRYMDKEDKINTLKNLSEKTIEQMSKLKEGGLI